MLVSFSIKRKFLYDKARSVRLEAKNCRNKFFYTSQPMPTSLARDMHLNKAVNK